MVFVVLRDVTMEVKKEIKILKSADSRMDDIVDDRGIKGGMPPPDGHLRPGPLPDCSITEAERELVGWNARTHTQIAAEYFVHGILQQYSYERSSEH